MAKRVKEQILEAAVDLFSRQGYLQTSMSDVAKAVGLTKGGIYHHIEKKDDLLRMIHNQMTTAFLDRFRQSGASESDPRKKLSNWVAAHIYLMRDYKPHIKIFFTEVDNLAKTDEFERILHKRDEIFQLLYGIIDEGIRQGQFRRDLHPRIVTLLIFGMLNWFYQWHQPQGQLSLETIIEDVTQFVSSGIYGPEIKSGSESRLERKET